MLIASRSAFQQSSKCARNRARSHAAEGYVLANDAATARAESANARCSKAPSTTGIPEERFPDSDQGAGLALYARRNSVRPRNRMPRNQRGQDIQVRTRPCRVQAARSSRPSHAAPLKLPRTRLHFIAGHTSTSDARRHARSSRSRTSRKTTVSELPFATTADLSALVLYMKEKEICGEPRGLSSPEEGGRHHFVASGTGFAPISHDPARGVQSITRR